MLQRRRPLRSGALLAVSLVVVACAGPPPAPDPVLAARLPGTWFLERVGDDAPVQLTLHADGSWTGVTHDLWPLATKLIMTLSGRWRLEGTELVVTVSEEPDRRARASIAEGVLRLDPDPFVPRPLGDPQPPINCYLRAAEELR